MITVTFLTIFLGCYALYNTSKKATLTKDGAIQKWLQNNVLYAKTTGICFLLISITLSLTLFGLSGGIITWLIAASVMFSLILLIAPFKIINYVFITVFSIITFIIETLL